jgi:hypothetical protein
MFEQSIFYEESIPSIKGVEIQNRLKHLETHNRFFFHSSDEYGDCYGDDHYEFTTIIDPQDRKRLLIVSRLNREYRVEHCPTLSIYGCWWHKEKWCSGNSRLSPKEGTDLPLSRFITQNPYIDFILSFPKEVVRHPCGSPRFGIGVCYQSEKTSRIVHKLSWLHLVPCTIRRNKRISLIETVFSDHIPTMSFLY